MIPSVDEKKAVLKTEFSLDNALHHLKNISEKVHHVGSDEHKIVQNYIVDELKKMGLNPEIQTQTAVNKKWFAATTTEKYYCSYKRF